MSLRAAFASCAALLLPLIAPADSRVESGSARSTLQATAHLDFKIVIPRVLSLDIADGPLEARGAQKVAIYTNSHNATLAATIPVSDLARGNIILSSAARKVISQNVDCAPGNPAAGARSEGTTRAPSPAVTRARGLAAVRAREAPADGARGLAAADAPQPDDKVICTASMP